MDINRGLHGGCWRNKGLGFVVLGFKGLKSYFSKANSCITTTLSPLPSHAALCCSITLSTSYPACSKYVILLDSRRDRLKEGSVANKKEKVWRIKHFTHFLLLCTLTYIFKNSDIYSTKHNEKASVALYKVHTLDHWIIRGKIKKYLHDFAICKCTCQRWLCQRLTTRRPGYLAQYGGRSVIVKIFLNRVDFRA